MIIKGEEVTYNPMETTELGEYQEFVAKVPQPSEDALEKLTGNQYKGWWAASQMTCEAGEVLELFEKSIRKGTELDKQKVIDECGDVVWGIACICNTVGITLDEVIENNIGKLSKRYYETTK